MASFWTSCTSLPPCRRLNIGRHSDEEPRDVFPEEEDRNALLPKEQPLAGGKRCPVSGILDVKGDGKCPFAKPKQMATPPNNVQKLEAVSVPADNTPPDRQDPPRGDMLTTAQPAVNGKGDAPMDQKDETVEEQPAKTQNSRPKPKKQQKSTKEDVAKAEPGCPASKAEAEFERELAALKARTKQAKDKPKQSSKAKKVEMYGMDVTALVGANGTHHGVSAGGGLNPADYGPGFGVSSSEREVKKQMFISFYKEQYTRLSVAGKPITVDVTQYINQNESAGLAITDGHRPMPKEAYADYGKNLPPDFRQPMGVICLEELHKHGSAGPRILISIHGDLFDVSDRPDKYGEEGPYWEMAGRDITWGLIAGSDVSENYDKFYDIFKFPESVLDRKLQGLCSWWAFFGNEYGEPVGRLAEYEREWHLPPPPWDGEEACSIM